jgi:hypothetical protein
MRKNTSLPLRTLSLAFAMAACLGAAACSEPDGGPADETEGEAVNSQSAALINDGGPGAEGGACKVTEGPYTGSSGTYDSDGWCCFDTVCVECSTSTGGSRCSDAVQSPGTTNPGPIVMNPGPIVWNPGPIVWNPGPIVWNPGGGGVILSP